MAHITRRRCAALAVGPAAPLRQQRRRARGCVALAVSPAAPLRHQRRRSRRCAALAVGIVALLVACSDSGGGEVPETAGQLDEYAYELPDGTAATLADRAEGAPLVVNFFASWCGPCKAEMPDFEAVSQAVGDEVTFLGLAVNDAADAAQAIIDETGVTYPWGLDSEDLLVDFDGIGMPTTVFFGAEGEYLESHVGVLSAADLESKLAEHFGVET